MLSLLTEAYRNSRIENSDFFVKWKKETGLPGFQKVDDGSRSENGKWNKTLGHNITVNEENISVICRTISVPFRFLEDLSLRFS